MKISIVLATCNGEKYLQEQLQSLLEQTRLPDELIIGDDASEDGTMEIVQEFLKYAPFKTSVVRNQKRLGYMQNFSSVATRASGDILAFCDQDDIWRSNKLAILEQHFQDNSRVSCVIHDIAIMDANGDVSTPSLIREMGNAGYSTNIFVKGCATAMKRELAQAVFPLPLNSGWAHDTLANVVAMVSGSRKIITDTLIHHRIHDSNVSGFIAEKPTIRRRLNMLVEQFEMSKLPSDLHPMLLPLECTEEDLDFMLNAASRIANDDQSRMSRSRTLIRAMYEVSKMRAAIRKVPAFEGVKLIIANRRMGMFQHIGSTRIVGMELLRILLRSLPRPRSSSSPPPR